MKFSFGRNWLSYSSVALDENKVQAAREAFRSLTQGIDLRGARFLDIGFGQGLALFLASEAGADVSGLDLDPLCREALETTHRFFPSLPLPEITIGSVLDNAFVQGEEASGCYDVVHSWGALHHTGDMSKALQNAAVLVKPDGFFILSIYNKHWTSPLWQAVKYGFNHLPRFMQETLIFALYPLFYLRARALSENNGEGTTRGMDIQHDMRDWLGGYPYEYASTHEIERTLARLGFVMVRCQPTRGFTGCNEFVFQNRNTS
jgi:2-polyprenyl-3-methyl-5-hydroxy-6-metoxy-1,4-benzoquinol methylase